MPFKDKEDRRKYAKEYYIKNRAELVKERADYHAAHSEIIPFVKNMALALQERRRELKRRI